MEGTFRKEDGIKIKYSSHMNDQRIFSCIENYWIINYYWGKYASSFQIFEIWNFIRKWLKGKDRLMGQIKGGVNFAFIKETPKLELRFVFRSTWVWIVVIIPQVTFKF